MREIKTIIVNDAAVTTYNLTDMLDGTVIVRIRIEGNMVNFYTANTTVPIDTSLDDLKLQIPLSSVKAIQRFV